ncbi:hypothetical protein D3C85_1872230 [compost metagenome]
MPAVILKANTARKLKKRCKKPKPTAPTIRENIIGVSNPFEFARPSTAVEKIGKYAIAENIIAP